MFAQSLNVWRYQFHPEVWFMVAMLVCGYIYMVRVIGPQAVPSGQPIITRFHRRSFVLAMLVLWVATDWPMHDISEDYLYSVHMVQHMLLSFVVPPLALMATPTWLARLVIGDGHLYRWLKRLTHPVVAGLLFNAVILITHLPPFVESAINSGWSHYTQHLLVVASSLLMWGVVCGPIPEFRLGSAGSMVFLFLQSIVPTVPAAWLTFAETAVYPVYDRPVRAFGIDLIADQQLAGAVMKVLGGIYLWIIIIYLFFKRFAAQAHANHDYRRGSRPHDTEIIGHAGTPLTTADVDAAFAATAPADDPNDPAPNTPA